MSFFKIIYVLNSKEEPHARYYRAESQDIALCMFNETVNHGSLVGYSPRVVNIQTIIA